MEQILVNTSKYTLRFDRYYGRPVQEKINNTSGTGLGLAITRNPIEFHEGIIGWKAFQGRFQHSWFKCPK